MSENLFLGDSTYPHTPEQTLSMRLRINDDYADTMLAAADENEALRQRVAELEAMVDQAQSYWDDILTKGESLKVENMRLQSECDRLK